jgi:hypothetical protein
MKIQQKTNELIREQVAGWQLLGENWAKLDAAQLRTFHFDGFTIQVQFNPRRITSSAAKVDKQSIESRRCFLCRENRPPEEGHVAFGEDYEILCNPFPIFRKHFTIARVEHSPQVIDTEFSRMLDLSRELHELVVFYNAPACGASAPDHMHFQAGEREFMPIERELGILREKYGCRLSLNRQGSITAIDDGLRRFILFESGDQELLLQAFPLISGYLRDLAGGEEPMLNILSYYREGWKVLVFPREKHRPWQYFVEGTGNILLSPAAVDMGGTLITPLEKDFRKIGREDIRDIFRQIGLSREKFDELCGLLEDRPAS